MHLKICKEGRSHIQFLSQHIHIHINTHTQKETLEVMNMFITLIVVIATWVDAYAQIHKIVYIKYGKFLV